MGYFGYWGNEQIYTLCNYAILPICLTKPFVDFWMKIIFSKHSNDAIWVIKIINISFQGNPVKWIYWILEIKIDVIVTTSKTSLAVFISNFIWQWWSYNCQLSHIELNNYPMQTKYYKCGLVLQGLSVGHGKRQFLLDHCLIDHHPSAKSGELQYYAVQHKLRSHCRLFEVSFWFRNEGHGIFVSTAQRNCATITFVFVWAV